MFGYMYAVMWRFVFTPPSSAVAIEGTNVFGYYWDYESAMQAHKKLRDAGYDAWVEEL